MYHQKNLSVILSVSLFLLFSFTFYFLKSLSPAYAADNDVSITEIMYNPEGSDSDYEWVEIYNSGPESVEIIGGSGASSWRVVDGSSNRTFSDVSFQGDMILSSNEYGILAKNPDQFVVRYPDYTGDIIQVSGMSLGNSGDSVGLKIGDDIWSLITYENSWGGQDDYSLSKVEIDGVNDQTNWVSSKEIHGSPGLPYAVNIFPVAMFSYPDSIFNTEEVVFDASNSSDEDGDIVSYQWNYGDGSSDTVTELTTAHVYNTEGEYTVSLTVQDDNGAEHMISHIITVQKKVYSSDIVLSEFLPAPGDETDWDKNGQADYKDEWIEIYNSGGEAINLAGWMLDDGADGSSAYVIPDGVSIATHEYLVFYRAETSLSLNNDVDSVRLFWPDGVLVEEFGYSETETDQVYAKDFSQKWQESITPTPGTENVIESNKDDVVQEDKDKKIVDNDTEKDGNKKVVEDEQENVSQDNILKKSSTEDETEADTSEQIPELTIEKARTQNIGTEIIIKGIVTATPEILGSRVIYIQDSTGGIKVKLLKGDYSILVLGDKLKISGEMSESYSERYLSMQSDSIFKVLSHKAAVEPKSVKTGDVNEKLEGELVAVSAQVVSTSGDTFYVDDGSGQVKVYIKDSSNIDKPKMRVGYYVRVTGVVSQYKDDYRILPRYQNDLIVSESPIEDGGVLGAAAELPDTGASGSSIALGMIILGFIIRIGIMKKFV